MRVRAAAGSRNSSRRCASPRETRTPGPWRRNRLAHSSIASRRLPRSNAPRNRRKPHSRRPWRVPSVSINKEIELGVRGRWPPLSECTICSDPASRSSRACRDVGCAGPQTMRGEYAARPHDSVPSTNLAASGFCTDETVAGWVRGLGHSCKISGVMHPGGVRIVNDARRSPCRHASTGVEISPSAGRWPIPQAFSAELKMRFARR
jgi:hypothetical protein